MTNVAKSTSTITSREKKLVTELVNHYKANQVFFKKMAEQLASAVHNSPALMSYVHSTKWRIKDPKSLKDKLFRKIKIAKQKGRKHNLSTANLFTRINDLAGFRILHLHTEQIIGIDRELREVFKESRYALAEKPKARTWDDESRNFYKAHGIRPVASPQMYTSVHYVIKPNNRTRLTCEIQVRTLAEELWGEVDHAMNYPHLSPVATCREQIKVLARVTSSCSRLVDSIYRARASRRHAKEKM